MAAGLGVGYNGSQRPVYVQKETRTARAQQLECPPAVGQEVYRREARHVPRNPKHVAHTPHLAPLPET